MVLEPSEFLSFFFVLVFKLPTLGGTALDGFFSTQSYSSRVYQKALIPLTFT